MTLRDANPIHERAVEGRTDWQQSREVYEDIMPASPAKYWRAMHVAAEDAPPVVNKDGKPPSDNVASGAKAFHLISPSTTGAISIRNAVIEYPPGAQTNIRWHNAEQAYYVIAGKGRIELTDETHEFEAGAGVFVPMRTKHQLFNEGDEPLKLLLVTTLVQRPCEDLAATSIDYREYMEQL